MWHFYKLCIKILLECTMCYLVVVCFGLFNISSLFIKFPMYVFQICFLFWSLLMSICWSQWPRSLRHRTAATRLLRLWVRIPSGTWTFVCCECWVLSGRGLCDKLITRPEESYRLWCVVLWSRKLKNEEAMTHWGLSRQKQTVVILRDFSLIIFTISKRCTIYWAILYNILHV